MPYWRAVPSSWMLYWKPPSPVMTTTCLSGWPTFAPSPAGKPKPSPAQELGPR